MQKVEQEQKVCTETVPCIDFIIINIPVWLFLFLALIAGASAFHFAFPLILVPLAAAWWSVCGSVMLFIDFLKRKRFLYFRVRVLLHPESKAHTFRSLKQTLCGFAVYAAALRYSHTI